MKTMLILTIALLATTVLAAPAASAGPGFKCTWSLGHVECEVHPTYVASVSAYDGLLSNTLA